MQEDVEAAVVEVAPDFAAPFVAWRTWGLTRNPTRLRSVVKPTVWQPCAALAADCLRPRLLRLRHHAAPETRCACGVYAAKLPVAASYLGDLRVRGESLAVRQVLGRVALWGEVVECERGYRAAFAYPQHLYVAARTADGRPRPDAYAVALALEDYHVPVTIVDLDEGALLRVLRAGERESPSLAA